MTKSKSGLTLSIYIYLKLKRRGGVEIRGGSPPFFMGFLLFSAPKPKIYLDYSPDEHVLLKDMLIWTYLFLPIFDKLTVNHVAYK